jgi:hypothetical protein
MKGSRNQEAGGGKQEAGSRKQEAGAFINVQWEPQKVYNKTTASCLLPPASYFLLPASCFLPPASCTGE